MLYITSSLAAISHHIYNMYKYVCMYIFIQMISFVDEIRRRIDFTVPTRLLPVSETEQKNKQ